MTLDAAGRASVTLFAVGRDAHVGPTLQGEHHVSDALAAAAVAMGSDTFEGCQEGILREPGNTGRSVARRGSRSSFRLRWSVALA